MYVSPNDASIYTHMEHKKALPMMLTLIQTQSTSKLLPIILALIHTWSMSKLL